MPSLCTSEKLHSHSLIGMLGEGKVYIMAETLYALIDMLADGCFHSGEALGKRLGIGRAAVWKSLQQLPTLGLELHAVNGRGYRLACPIEHLNERSITSLLDAQVAKSIKELHLLPSIDSTSKYLKQLADTGAPSGTVCLAEYQSEGRGRRGRRWHSPYGSNIYLSLLWRFSDGMTRLGGLSLAVAVALMRCFEQHGARGLGIKWPNDIVAQQGKLAGILLDVAGESGGPCYAVIGVGINYSMSESVGEPIEQAWTQLQACGASVGRNALVANLLENLIEVVALYERLGFEPFRKEWQRWDILRNHAVELVMANDVQEGIARGIDEAGMLLVEQQGQIRPYAAGEVTLRKAVL